MNRRPHTATPPTDSERPQLGLLSRYDGVLCNGTSHPVQLALLHRETLQQI